MAYSSVTDTDMVDAHVHTESSATFCHYLDRDKRKIIVVTAGHYSQVRCKNATAHARAPTPFPGHVPRHGAVAALFFPWPGLMDLLETEPARE